MATAATCCAVAVVIALLGLASLCLGTPAIAPSRLTALGADPVAGVLVGQVRMPRLLIGLVGGACFAIAGLLLQETLRNPLATPELLGIGPGAALVVATVVVWSLPVASSCVPLLALAGALAGGAVTVLVARSVRSSTAALLAGAAVGAAMSALVVAVTSMAEQLQVQALFKYLSGSLAGLTWAQVIPGLVWAGLLLPWAWASLPWLLVLRLGDETAAAVGARVARARWLTLALAAALVAAVISATGPIAWIGFLGPHIARALAPHRDARTWLPLSAAMGAIVTVTADLGARLWFAPVETPVGAWTAMLGVSVAVIGLTTGGRRRRGTRVPQRLARTATMARR